MEPGLLRLITPAPVIHSSTLGEDHPQFIEKKTEGQRLGNTLKLIQLVNG